jgi:hypothetical protein
MVIIKTKCSTCGEVDLRPSDIDLILDREDPNGSSFTFRCPACRSRVRCPANTHIIDVLVSAGVRAVGRWLEPLPSAAEHAPAFQADDLLDFHLLLDRPDWFDRLLAIA